MHHRPCSHVPAEGIVAHVNVFRDPEGVGHRFSLDDMFDGRPEYITHGCEQEPVKMWTTSLGQKHSDCPTPSQQLHWP